MATKYLQLFPKPLLDDLVSGRWLPVVGAGMSLNARLPSSKKMPLWPDLGKALAEELTDFVSNGTLDAISAYQHEFGRAKLIERLTDILLIKDAVPGEAHKAFCSIPFDIVCTTNFDFLLERQYEQTPRYVYPVVDEEQLSISGSTAGTLLLKLHGDLHHPSRLIVTEEDYDAFLARYPLIATYLSNQLITKTALFIGYSLDDPDFRQIWNIVSDRLGRTRRMAYAVMASARPSDITRFERRGVKVINLPGSRERYGEILAGAFLELREYMRDNVIAASQVTEERPLHELLLPRDAPTRLCFFSLPLELLSLYRSQIFPLVEEIGLVPVTADDVVSPGDNINAKIDALIDRASVMVVELSSQWTRAEYDIAVARMKGAEPRMPHRRSLEIIIVTTDADQVPASGRDFTVVYRSSLLSEDTDGFAERLANKLRKIASTIGRDQEPRRLLEAREYRAAVISAMTLLETWLREHIPIAVSFVDTKRNFSLRHLIDIGSDRELLQLSPRDRQHLTQWMKIRNEAVHTVTPISRAVAREIVEGVLDLIERHREPDHERRVEPALPGR
jgi:SIR2-like domain